MTLTWRYAVRSDVGLHRDGNEDSAYAGARLLAVADGMGGHAAGEVASAAAIAALSQIDELGLDAGDPQEALRDAVMEANTNLRDMVIGDSDLHGMGTTVTALVADGDRLVLAHIGDSRAYRLRDGELTQLTRDHTLVQQLIDEGRIAPEEAQLHPQRSMITRALDGRDNLEPDLEMLDIEIGDRFLLCSDGLSGVVTDDTMAKVLLGTTLDDAAEQLIDLTLRAGAPDNVTCIVADIVDEADAPPIAAPADVETTADPVQESPAAAAAALTRPASHQRTHDPLVRSRGLRRRRAVVITLVTVALLALAAGAGWAWLRAQYYVGVDTDRVAIFRGVKGTVAGVELSSVEQQTALSVSQLPDFQQADVRDGIEAADLAEARTIVQRLTALARPTPTPKPTPARTPSTTPTPSRTPTPAKT